MNKLRVHAAVQAYQDGFTWFADAERMMIREGMLPAEATDWLAEVAAMSIPALKVSWPAR